MVLGRHAESGSQVCAGMHHLPAAEKFLLDAGWVLTAITGSKSCLGGHLPRFCGGIAEISRLDTILVVVDRLSKYAHFIGLCHPFTALTIAHVFVKEIVRLHGYPSTIVSDRDKIFMSLFWRELFRMQGTGLHRSTAYHPQTDGQTEVVNKTMEGYLRCFINGKPKGWAKWLPWAEYWYNTSCHTSTKRSPFEVVYGREPPPLVRFTDGSTTVASVDEQLRERDAILDDLKANILLTQQQMKAYEDSHRREVEFQAGEMVYLKLQPYCQSSLAARTNEKLSPRFYGPFTILGRVGKVAYRLDLPPTAKIHNVFHVSQLKKAIGSAHVSPSVPPQITADLVLEAEPDALLAVRTKTLGDHSAMEVLIQWQQLPPWESTWEDFHALNCRFPHFHLEDKVAVWARGNAETPRDIPPVLLTYSRSKVRGKRVLSKEERGNHDIGHLKGIREE